MSHVSPIKAAVSWALGAGRRDGVAFAPRPGVDLPDRRVSPVAPILRTFNETWHLAAVR